MNTLSKPRKRRISLKRNKFSIFSVIICFFLAIYSIMLIGLLVWAIRASLLPFDYDAGNEYLHPEWGSVNYWGINKFFHPENYYYAFKYFSIDVKGKDFGFGDSFLNSFMYSFISSFLQTICTATVAYLTAKYDNKFSRFFHTFVLFSLVLPIAGSAASLFSLVNNLGIYDTWWAPIMMKFGFTNMYYLVFYAGFKRISWNYAESAFIDGAGHFYVYFKIMLPLVAGLFGTVMLVYFIEFWNDYSFPVLYMPSYPTSATVMQKTMLGNTTINVDNFVPIGMSPNDWIPITDIFGYIPMQVAASTLVCVPIVILFIIFNKRLTGNLTEGGIKE